MGDPIHARHLGIAHSMGSHAPELLKHWCLGSDSEGSKVQNFWRLLLSPSPYSSWIICLAYRPGLSCLLKHYYQHSIYFSLLHFLSWTANRLSLSAKKMLASPNHPQHSTSFVSWIISITNLLSFFNMKLLYSHFFWSLQFLLCFLLVPIITNWPGNNCQAPSCPACMFFTLIFFSYFSHLFVLQTFQTRT